MIQIVYQNLGVVYYKILAPQQRLRVYFVLPDLSHEKNKSLTETTETEKLKLKFFDVGFKLTRFSNYSV